MRSIEESLEKFNDLPAEIILETDSQEIADKMSVIENKYGVKIASLIIFLITGDVKADRIEKYLKTECELDESNAKNCGQEIMENIYDPLFARISFLDANPDKNFPVVKEKEIIMKMFESGILKELDKHIIVKNAINYRIFYALSHDLSFKDVLKKKLFKNEERSTGKIFKLNGKTDSPSIKNWVDDFIKKHGSGIFTNITLSDYLSDSENARILDESEKRLVRLILILYRNIVFFPESMPSDDGEGWEILPLELENEDLKNKKPMGPPKTKQEKNIDVLMEEEKKYQEGGLEQMALEEGISSEKNIEDLEIEAKKYKEGSLERMVIEEEIRNMEKE
ncbi:MAG: hypothetical protein ABH881_03395 [bacterium]